MPVEVELTLHNSEAATAPDRAAKIILNLEWRASGDGQPNIVALPHLLPGPELRGLRGGVVFICARNGPQREDECKCQRECDQYLHGPWVSDADGGSRILSAAIPSRRFMPFLPAADECTAPLVEYP